MSASRIQYPKILSFSSSWEYSTVASDNSSESSSESVTLQKNLHRYRNRFESSELSEREQNVVPSSQPLKRKKIAVKTVSLIIRKNIAVSLPLATRSVINTYFFYLHVLSQSLQRVWAFLSCSLKINILYQLNSGSENILWSHEFMNLDKLSDHHLTFIEECRVNIDSTAWFDISGWQSEIRAWFGTALIGTIF